MWRVREHVERVDARDRVTGVDNLPRVARERRNITRDIDDAAAIKTHKALKGLAGHSGSRRIHDHDIAS